MSEGLNALLGCVQSEVSQSNLSGVPEQHVHWLMQTVVLPTLPERAQVVTLACKHCQQAVRVRMSSRSAIRRKRLLTRFALAASVCLWVAAAGFLLLYLVDGYPATPGREMVLAGFLVALGVVVWASIDARDAFGGEVAVGCKIEHTREEKSREGWVSPRTRWAIPRHVLLDCDHDFAPAHLQGEIGRNLA